MAGHAPKYLPDFRRVVTGHNGQGLAVVLRNGLVKSEVSPAYSVAAACRHSMSYTLSQWRP